jgi:hypothetical protein
MRRASGHGRRRGAAASQAERQYRFFAQQLSENQRSAWHSISKPRRAVEFYRSVRHGIRDYDDGGVPACNLARRR